MLCSLRCSHAPGTDLEAELWKRGATWCTSHRPALYRSLCRPLRLQAAAAYLEALQALQPPLTPLSSFEATAPLVPESAAYAVLSERRREQIFTAYVTALDKAERAARSKAQTAFQVGTGWG